MEVKAEEDIQERFLVATIASDDVEEAWREIFSQQ